MIKTDCPACRSPLRAPEKYAGKRPRCPVCKTQVPAVASAPEPGPEPGPAPGPKNVVDELLEEAAPERAERKRAGAQVAEPAVAARSRRSVGQRRTRVTVAFLIGVLAFVSAAFFAVRHIVGVMRTRQVGSVLAEIDTELGPVKQSKKRADDTRAAGLAKVDQEKFDEARALYKEAKRLYEDTLARGIRLKQNVESCLDRYATAGIGDRLLAAQQEVDAIAGEIRAILDTEEMRKGVEAGTYALYEGKWVTPEERTRLFEEEMKKQGKALFQGKWLTHDEIMRLRGYVMYRGTWRTKDEYEAIVKKEAADVALAEQSRRDKEDAIAQLEAEKKRKAALFAPDKELWVLDDFEVQSRQWQVMGWADCNSCDLKWVERDQNKKLEVRTHNGLKEKCVVQCPLGLDFSSRTSLSFQVENTGRAPISVAVALDTTAFYESREKQAGPGTSEITFDLTAGDFKSKATNWLHTSKLKDLQYVQRIFLVIYKAGEETLYVDNIYAKRAK